MNVLSGSFYFAQGSLLNLMYFIFGLMIVLNVLGIVGAAKIMSGSSLPFFGKISQNGFQSGWTGWGTLLALIAAAGIMFKESDNTKPVDNATQKIVFISGVVATLFPIIAMLIISFNNDYALASLGFGIFLSLIGGLGVLAMLFVVKDNGDISMPNKQSITDELNQMRND